MDFNKRTNVLIKKSRMIHPRKIQACERLSLFLEGISPDLLMVRVYKPGMNSVDLHGALLSNIRTEYEHNLSQQLYVSAPTWLLIKNAKEEIIRLINLSISNSENKDDIIHINSVITTALLNLETNPITVAIDALRGELYGHIS